MLVEVVSMNELVVSVWNGVELLRLRRIKPWRAGALLLYDGMWRIICDSSRPGQARLMLFEGKSPTLDRQCGCSPCELIDMNTSWRGRGVLEILLRLLLV